MSEASPRPWQISDPFDDGFPTIRDMDGRQIATMDGDTPFQNEANAALIVDAVNERDRLAADKDRYRTDNVRLRDLMRRLSRHLANYITSESENDLLRDARAALGEDAP